MSDDKRNNMPDLTDPETVQLIDAAHEFKKTGSMIKLWNVMKKLLKKYSLPLISSKYL